ncbi:MAG: CNNM domain-containing protein [Bacteroidetes bacterium]|nr:CNNM domain-containing protein [Bacteroidota bacterium]MCY4205820.1 CNNM domain-containing protein [Bacteroidota bacterium]
MDPPEDPYLIVLSLLAQVQALVSPIEIVVFLLLLLASAIVSGSEVALFSLSATNREALLERADRRSMCVLTLLEKPRHLLVNILLLNTLINVSVAILATFVTTKIIRIIEPRSEIAVFAIQVVALTFILLIISEITPKLIASRYAITYSRRVAGGLTLISKPLYPVTLLLARMSSAFQGIYRNWRANEDSEVLSSDDLKAMAEIGKDHGSLEDDEHKWIQSLLDFGETTVRTIMINRLDVSAIPITASLTEALELIRTCGHSRLPLYKDHLDNIQGIVYAKDLLSFLDLPDTEVDWEQILRPPIFVPLGRKLDDLLQDFQRRRTHIAIVVDEYGGTAGLVTLDDVLEEVVGEIEDEHDEARDTLVIPTGEHEYRVDARINLIDLGDTLEIFLQSDSNEFETLGGLIFHLAGDIPEPGYTTMYHQLELSVEAVENNRIRTVHIRFHDNDNESHELDS